MNPYGIKTGDSNIRGPIVSLKILYEEMPETSGCEQCSSVNGDNNKDWCCRSMNPSMYYVEFLYSWEKVQKWSKKDRVDLVVRAIRNYLINSLNKGCIFYVNGCKIYNQRPLACREYGVIPAEGWQERIEMGKKRFGPDYVPKNQCNLVRTKTGKPVTKEDEDKWFLHTRKSEERIGIPKDIINSHDGGQGSYRTFHDHLLIELFDDPFLNNLTKIRLQNNTLENIDSFVGVLKDTIEKVVK